jgi:hypothetical protein
MTPSPLTHDCPRTNRSRWRSTGNARTRGKPPILPALEPQMSLPPKVAQPVGRRIRSAKRALKPLQSKLIKPAAGPSYCDFEVSLRPGANCVYQRNDVA